MDSIQNDILLTLTAAELKTALALKTLSKTNGTVETTVEQLQEITGYSPATLRRAFRGLESKELLTTTRTKRNFGKFSVNKYALSPSLIDERWTDSPSLTDERSTSGKDSLNSLYSNIANISYIDNITKGKPKEKIRRIVLGANQRWYPKGDDTSGDDEIGGVGLFEDEKPAAVKTKLSVDARDPKTRGRRPQETWTPSDVVAEFTYLLSRKYPYLPGLVQAKELRGALAQNRKKYGITSVIELEVMRLFLGDSRLHSDAEKNPQYLHKRFLKMFSTHLDEAMNNLGMPSRKEIFYGTINTSADEDEIPDYVFASDGRRFDNSINGRRNLAKHEERLRAKNGI